MRNGTIYGSQPVPKVLSSFAVSVVVVEKHCLHLTRLRIVAVLLPLVVPVVYVAMLIGDLPTVNRFPVHVRCERN